MPNTSTDETGEQSITSRLSLYMALCKILTYMCCQRICHHVCGGTVSELKDDPEVFNLLCLGLDGAGKSWLLSMLAGHDTNSPNPPTIGFAIKTINLDEKATLTITELGGSDSIRPYWNKYFSTHSYNGLLYVINTSTSESSVQNVHDSLHQLGLVLTDDNISPHMPVLILLNHKDKAVITENEMVGLPEYGSLLEDLKERGSYHHIEVVDICEADSVKSCVSQWLHQNCNTPSTTHTKRMDLHSHQNSYEMTLT